MQLVARVNKKLFRYKNLQANYTISSTQNWAMIVMTFLAKPPIFVWQLRREWKQKKAVCPFLAAPAIISGVTTESSYTYFQGDFDLHKTCMHENENGCLERNAGPSCKTVKSCQLYQQRLKHENYTF